MMSAKDTDVDKAVGLGLGADDYICKPFSMIELVRRKSRYSEVYEILGYRNNRKMIQIGDLTIDPINFTVENGKPLKLTLKEFEILKLFVKNQNRVFTKAQIYTLVWNEEYYGDDNVINVHMRRLREKIESDPSNPEYIKTLWGIGYKLEVM